MLHKCANPNCANPFRRLSEGKLFLVDTEATPPPSLRHIEGQGRVTRHIEHYWLCSECASVLTLAFEEGRGMVTVPLGTAPPRLPPTSIRPAELGTRRGSELSALQKMA